MVPAGNKAKRLSSVNHTTKTIHHYLSSSFFSGLVFPYPIHSAAVIKVKLNVNLQKMICLELVEDIR